MCIRDRFQTSATGRLFIEFAVAVAGSVAVSAFVALSLSPMMAARLLKPIDHARKKFFVIRWFDSVLGFFTRIYERTLRWSLAHRFVVVIVAAGSLWITYEAFRHLEGEFLPEEDKSRLLSFVFGPEGSTTEYTDRQVRKMEAILTEVPEVEAYGSVTAFAFAGPGLAN